MKANRLKCPSCSKSYPITRLIFQIGWRVRCPFCGSCLAFSEQSAQRLGAILGFTIAPIIFLVGDSIFTWPTFAWYMLFAFGYARVLFLVFGSLAPAPKTLSLDPFPNQTRGWKILSIMSMAGIAIVIFSGLVWEGLPPGGMLTVVVFMVPFSIILFISTAHNLFGRNGVFKKRKNSEQGSGTYI